MYRGVCCQPYASVSWRAIQSALGRAVTPSHRSSRRQCCRIRNPYNSRNEIVGTTNKSIEAMPSSPATAAVFSSPCILPQGQPDIDAKLEQFAVDPWRSPKRVRDAHVANKLANVCRCLWPAAARSRFPAPTGSKPSAVPADHRLRLEDFQCVQYSRRHMIERGKHQPVNAAERQSLRGFAPQHVELMSKDEVLGLQRSPRPEHSNQGAPDQPAKIAHRERVSADSRSRSAVLSLR